MAADLDRNDSTDFDSPGARDFWFGVIGLGTIVVIAIVLAFVG